MHSIIQLKKYIFIVLFFSQALKAVETVSSTPIDLPAVLEQHQQVNGESAFGYWKKLLSPQHTTEIAYVGAYKMHQNIENASYIVQMIEECKTRKPSITKYKVFSENRLSDVEKRSIASLEMPGWQAFEQAAGPFLVKDLDLFKNVHFKILLTDHCFSVGTTNFDGELDPQRPYHSRDFTAFITDPLLIEEGKKVFEDILAKKTPTIQSYKVCDLKQGETRLSWGPWHHLDHILQLIQQAESTITIYQQDLQSLIICESLKEKLKQGVKVKILMSGYPFSKEHGNKNLKNLKVLKDFGAETLLTGEKSQGQFFKKPLHIHAKILICDAGTPEEAMYLGSANFWPDVLDPEKNHLNVGIITKDKNFIEPVMTFFQGDWEDHIDFEAASLEYWDKKTTAQKIL